MTSNAQKPADASVADGDIELLQEALAVLEAITEEGLTFTTEQAVGHTIAKIKARLS